MSDFLKKVKGSFGKQQAPQQVQQSNIVQQPQQQQQGQSNQKVEIQNTQKVIKPGGGWDQEEEELKTKKQSESMFEKMQGNQNQVKKQEQKQEQNIKQTQQQTTQAKTKSTQEDVGQHIEPGQFLIFSDFEQKLVDDITTPGGVRQRPSDKMLQEFINRCKFLDPEIIINILVYKVQAGVGNSGQKALHCLLALISAYQNYKDKLNKKKYMLKSFKGPVVQNILDKLEGKEINESNQSINANKGKTNQINFKEQKEQSNLLEQFDVKQESLNTKETQDLLQLEKEKSISKENQTVNVQKKEEVQLNFQQNNNLLDVKEEKPLQSQVQKEKQGQNDKKDISKELEFLNFESQNPVQPQQINQPVNKHDILLQKIQGIQSQFPNVYPQQMPYPYQYPIGIQQPILPQQGLNQTALPIPVQPGPYMNQPQQIGPNVVQQVVYTPQQMLQIQQMQQQYYAQQQLLKQSQADQQKLSEFNLGEKKKKEEDDFKDLFKLS